MSGNQLKKDNDAYKSKYIWKGEDDATFKGKIAPIDNSSTLISVEPQRIRTFYFTYS